MKDKKRTEQSWYTVSSRECEKAVSKAMKANLTSACFKGIVSRDWGELQMISVDSLEVLSITGSYFYFLKQCFHA